MARKKTGKPKSARGRKRKTLARRRKAAAPASRRKRAAPARKAAARRPSATPGRRKPGTSAESRSDSPRRGASGRRDASAPGPDSGVQGPGALDADRARLGLRRGEDMGVAAEQAELDADRAQARDAVHERDLSGS